MGVVNFGWQYLGREETQADPFISISSSCFSCFVKTAHHICKLQWTILLNILPHKDPLNNLHCLSYFKDKHFFRSAHGTCNCWSFKTINITFFSPLQEVITLLLVKIQVRRNNLKTMSENYDGIVGPWLRSVSKTMFIPGRNVWWKNIN